MRRRALAAAGAAFALPALAALTPVDGVLVEPLAGLHEVELCVTIAEQPPGCGAAEAIVAPDGDISVRISDIVYRIGVQGGAVGVIVMHGTMQIDGFVAAGAWAGSRLQFHDKPKGARYEVRFPEAAIRTRRQESR